ncbi:hypothetical protein [Serratia sp. UGAL515B_01]|uniref:relaxosome protein TraM n=1 Tax=Serratia sp. UGAL515B_01 TaxID=2986763 RepID=UPI00295527E9|nr:hypothetical protein [Serratia sp. UGAL515B_01]WON75515.1 hypothetical protein OK023_00170 [Serratia sp. UGAL515B_01]
MDTVYKNSDEHTKSRPNRVNLTVPHSLLEVVDRNVNARLDDGESRDTANRAAFVMEMFKLGLRVHENKKKKDEGEVTLNDQLKMMSRNILISSFLAEAIFSLIKETLDMSKVQKSETYLANDFMMVLDERITGKLMQFFK